MKKDPLLQWFATRERILDVDEMHRLIAKASTERGYDAMVRESRNFWYRISSEKKKSKKQLPAQRKFVTQIDQAHLDMFKKWRLG